jgi:hypothetical protein
MTRNRPVIVTTSLAAMLLAAPFVSGQSLAEIARKEKEKREAAKAAGAQTKTYGDKDLETYAGERPADGAPASGDAPAMSATPKTPAAEKVRNDEESTDPSPQERKAEAERVRGRWREAKERVASAEERLKVAEDQLKGLPPGLPAGNYMQDTLDAVAAQRAAQERQRDTAQKALAAAKEALDAVETEARRKSIRLD